MKLTFASSDHIEVSGTTKTYGKKQVENTVLSDRLGKAAAESRSDTGYLIIQHAPSQIPAH